jgi:DNA-binding MarR family transcriptional regulator
MQDDEIQQFRAQMKLLQRRLRQEVPPVDGLSRTGMQILSAVGRRSGAVQPSQIADELRMTSSNVAAALRDLEVGKFIRREKDPEDARRVLLSVTDRGATVVADFQSERDTWLGKAIAAVLSDDEQRLLNASGQLMQRLAEYEPSRPPVSRQSS